MCHPEVAERRRNDRGRTTRGGALMAILPRVASLAAASVLTVMGLVLLPLDRAHAQAMPHEIHGVVVDEDGRPVEGLSVLATEHYTEEALWEVTETGAGGTFRLAVREGRHELSIFSGTYSDCTLVGPGYPDGLWRAILPMEGGEETRVRLVVGAPDPPPRQTRVQSHFEVPHYRIAGTVLGPDDRPVAGVSVRRLLPHSSSYSLAPGAVTASDGTWEIEVPADRQLLHLSLVLDDAECEL
ncbi:MAG: carboxypeptidase regulatory-like domain-containing protein, partial [Gemmatimonadetes bacterium]|nr:carboxypeptidase regulatory-like domain-containing protein [Gemmatimonadota bacterium]